jgi:hypothetical protein
MQDVMAGRAEMIDNYEYVAVPVIRASDLRVCLPVTTLAVSANHPNSVFTVANSLLLMQ